MNRNVIGITVTGGQALSHFWQWKLERQKYGANLKRAGIHFERK